MLVVTVKKKKNPRFGSHIQVRFFFTRHEYCAILPLPMSPNSSKQAKRSIDRSMLDVLHPVNPAKGHIRAKQNVFLQLYKWRKLEKMRLNHREGIKWVGIELRSPLSRHSIQSYILTHYGRRKREIVIALGSDQVGGEGRGGGGNFCIRDTPPRGNEKEISQTITFPGR